MKVRTYDSVGPTPFTPVQRPPAPFTSSPTPVQRPPPRGEALVHPVCVAQVGEVQKARLRQVEREQEAVLLLGRRRRGGRRGCGGWLPHFRPRLSQEALDQAGGLVIRAWAFPRVCGGGGVDESVDHVIKRASCRGPPSGTLTFVEPAAEGAGRGGGRGARSPAETEQGGGSVPPVRKGGVSAAAIVPPPSIGVSPTSIGIN